MRHLLWAPTVLAALASAQAILTTQHAEVDIVFPRNTTYKPADVFPIVLAIQNLAVLQSLDPEFFIAWDIMPFSRGITPGGITYDSGTFALPNNATDPTFLVTTTNVTTWLSRKQRDERFVLQWYLAWPRLETCGGNHSLFAGTPAEGAVMFNVEAHWGGDGPDSWKGEIHDVPGDVPECPALGGVIEVGPGKRNATCDGTAVGLLPPAATVTASPCAVTVGPAEVSSFASAASSQAAESWALHPRPAEPAPSTSSAGAGRARAVQTALAAACVLGGLAL